jgi:hypothetical protein
MVDRTSTQEKVFFVVGPPRSGSTLLARMIGSHTQIYSRPEPHMLTPLAHLGYYDKVDKAPYDAILAAESMRQFVADLPRGEQDYIDACRAYSDTLYLRMLSNQPEARFFLDKTPAYALVLDFIARIYPQARYVVLTRHPLAVFSSYAESFFDSDYEAAYAYNPILERYVPAIAKFLRAGSVPIHHVVYERMVADPEAALERVFAFLDVANEPEAVNYGEHEHVERGLGDPIGVAKHSRPTTASINKWAIEIAIWAPLDEAGASGLKPKPKKLDRYRLERKAIVKLRSVTKNRAVFRRLLERMRLVADVLLRD